MAFGYTEYLSTHIDQILVAGHELGHLWSAGHCNNTCTPCIMMCTNHYSCNIDGDLEISSCVQTVIETSPPASTA